MLIPVRWDVVSRQNNNKQENIVSIKTNPFKIIINVIMIFMFLTLLPIVSQLLILLPVVVNSPRKPALQSLSGNCVGTFKNSSEIQITSGKMKNGKTSTIRDKTFFEETRRSLLNANENFNNWLNYYMNVSWKESDKDGVQFDLRKREDTYKKAEPKENPYAVLLLIKIILLGGMTCSGSLLTAEWVLTAAHCLDVPVPFIASVMVYAGGNSVTELTDVLDNTAQLPADAQLIKAKRIVTHPNYEKLPLSFDIGLVKVSHKFTMTDTVNTIKLSIKPWRHRGYRTCVTTGFGVVRYQTESADDGERKTHTLEVKKPCVCSFMMSFLFGFFRGEDPVDTFICSMPRQDYGICSGDSGGGLVCEEDGERKITGINQALEFFDDVTFCELSMTSLLTASYKSECGDKNSVSLFKYTYSHLPWINRYTQLFSEDEMLEVEQTLATAARRHTYIWANILGIYLVKLFLFVILCRG